MVTYLQLESEQVWHDQIVPPFMTSFLIVPLRQFYGLDANTCGAPGDNNHLYGRHRSANWDRQSRYCTNPAYGTTDARDHAGDQNWYRAVDTGIQGQKLWDASHRLDNAVRAGQLPELAEWFGTFDGMTVVGWYQGHPSSSDSSHLYHLHVGLWNQYANDFQVMQRIYNVITGTSTPTTVEDHMYVIVPGPNSTHWLCDGMYARQIHGDAELADLRYIASVGAISLWKDKDGNDIWNGGLVPAFGVDVATLAGSGLAPHTHSVAAVPSAATGPAVPTP